MPRTFEAAPAVRTGSQLLLGLSGASGGGKTFSALRLARGIQRVTGGDIFYIDTDNRRALHYADNFRKADGSPGFVHVNFEPPHNSDAYVDAIRFAVAEKAGVLIIDSMSHEHEGEGGLLDAHEAEVDRMAGANASHSKRESVKMLAWGKPKEARRRLVHEIQRLRIPTIFCYRAKTGVKLVRVTDAETGRTKTEVVPQGFTPIAGDELVFEMTLNALLMPNSGGVATWESAEVGEKRMIKLPEQFKSLRERTKPLDEELGENFAKWARGPAGVQSSAAAAATEAKPAQEAARKADKPAAPKETPKPEEPAQATETGQDEASRDYSDEALEARAAAASERVAELEGDSPRPTVTDGAPTAETEPALSASADHASATSPGPSDNSPSESSPNAERGSPETERLRPDEQAAAERAQARGFSSETTGLPEAPADTPAPQEAASGAGDAGPAADDEAGPVEFMLAIDDATTWPPMVAAYGAFQKTAFWKDAAPAVRAKLRAHVYGRVVALNANGLKLDWITEAHAVRCFIDWENKPGEIELRMRYFQRTKAFANLPEAAQRTILDAGAERAALLRAAEATTADGEPDAGAFE